MNLPISNLAHNRKGKVACHPFIRSYSLLGRIKSHKLKQNDWNFLSGLGGHRACRPDLTTYDHSPFMSTFNHFNLSADSLKKAK